MWTGAGRRLKISECYNIKNPEISISGFFAGKAGMGVIYRRQVPNGDWALSADRKARAWVSVLRESGDKIASQVPFFESFRRHAASIMRPL